MDLASKLFKGDRVIWVIFMFLCLISIVEVFSASSTLAYKHANHWAPIVRHTSFLLAGGAIILVMHHFHYRYFSAIVLLLPVSIILLLLAPIIGVEINGGHRWINIAGIQFQPSEIAKLSCIVFVAFMLSRQNKFTEKQIYKYILIGVGTTCVFIFSENLSTCILLFSVCFMMMFIGQISIMRLAKTVAAIVLGLSLVIAILKFGPQSITQHFPERGVTWVNRLEAFFEKKTEVPAEEFKITDENFQVSHAKIAIAQGGALGKLPGHSQQRDFLPQAFSDFIYAIIIEELGIVGGLFVLLLYITLLVRVGMISRKCDHLFPKILVLGCGLLIVVQALANMAVAVNLIPVTGQPLPLISRGGTSTVITCIYFGIILSISHFGAKMGESESSIEEESINESAIIGQEQLIPATVVEQELSEFVMIEEDTTIE
ncbi:FtsW/RodA/SpoVE family cell cycle protein [Parabacteroides sp. OttesenSCG-928-N08]|nr:FtsW/RodA/SpoVE family cell cycle protein [Parabacteroides sp. OttesenSCG-928-N08]